MMVSVTDAAGSAEAGVNDALNANHTALTGLLQISSRTWIGAKRLIDRTLYIEQVNFPVAIQIAG